MTMRRQKSTGQSLFSKTAPTARCAAFGFDLSAEELLHEVQRSK